MDWISLLNIALFQPERLKFPNAWIGHIPFAAWLIRTLRPRIFVELGTHSGNSYFAFCQAVKEGHLPTRCFAVDTWKGDEHAGFYGEEVFEDVSSYNEQKYSHFSRLLRMTFDEAVAYFPNNAIDLLHIDGMHTYESVKHDFETWLPKLSNQAIVVFHDTNVRERNFGVWKLWQELCDRFPLNFEFFHSHGLGVLLVSKEDSDYDDKPDSQLDWLSGDYPHRQFIREYFSALGLWLREKYLKQDLESKSHDAERLVEALRAELSASRERAAGLEAQLAEREQELEGLRAELSASREGAAGLEAQLAEREQHNTALTLQKAALQQELDAVRQHQQEREQILQDLNNKLLEIYSSTAWKIIQWMWRVRLLLFPKGSKVEKLAKTFIGRIKKKNKSRNKNIINLTNSIDGKNVQETSQNNDLYEFKNIQQTTRFRGLFKDTQIYDELPPEIIKVAWDCANKKTYKISVVIPTWNRESVICRAIQSVLDQSLPPYEIIVSDDGSTDNTTNKIKDAFKDEVENGKIKIVTNPHKGVSFARNKALEKVSGEIVTYLDSDCVWRKDYLLLVNAIYCDSNEINTAYFAQVRWDLDSGNKKYLYVEYDRRKLLVSNFIDLNVFSHRAFLLNFYGSFDEELSRLVDWDFVIRYTKLNPPITIPYIGVDYYLSREKLRNITYTQPLDDNRNKILNKHFDERIKFGLETIRLAYVLWDYPALSQTFVLNEIKWLVNKGFDVKVYYKIDPDVPADIDFVVESFKVRDYEDLANYFLEHDRNYCHSHFVYPAVTELVYPACKLRNIPFTFMPHAVDIFLRKNRERNKIREISLDPLCKRIFVYGMFHSKFIQEEGVPNDKISFTFQAVDLDDIEFKPRLRGVNKKETKVLFIGRFIEKKGIQYLIKAANILKYENFVFDFYGYGPLQDELIQMATEFDLRSVSFKGKKSNKEIKNLYKNYDILCVPCVVASNGDMDGFPTVILEAMAAGVIVITTKIAAIPDYIRDGVEGFLVEPNNPEHLAKALKKARDMSDAQRIRMIKNAKKLIDQKIGTEKTMKILLDTWMNREIDLFTVTFNPKNSDDSENTIEIIRRVVTNTTTPYNLTIIDNGSDIKFLEKIFMELKNKNNVRFIKLDRNILLGEASNIALRKVNSKYLIYFCSKEGYVKAKGWERSLVGYMDNNPNIPMAGYSCYQPKYILGSEVIKHPLFDQFRAKEYLKSNPNHVFHHVQGGIYIANRKTMIDNDIFFSLPHDGMDVEISYFILSKGFNLGHIQSIVSVTKKTLPDIYSRLDETVLAAHPLDNTKIEKFENITKDTTFCNICKTTNTIDSNQDWVCKRCGSTPSERLIYRVLSEDWRIYRNELGVSCFVNNQTLIKEISRMFNLVESLISIDEINKVKNHKQLKEIIINHDISQLKQKDVFILMNQLEVLGEIIFLDSEYVDEVELIDAKRSEYRSIASSAKKLNSKEFIIQYVDYVSTSCRYGNYRAGKIIRLK